MKRDFAALVAQTLIEQLEQGTAPLLRPWRPGERFMPYNPVTGRNYRGINAIWLMLVGGAHTDLRWLTYKQARSLGGQIRRGEKGTVIQYWRWREERPLLDEHGQPAFHSSECQTETALDIIRGPVVPNEVMCGLHGQAYIAQTSIKPRSGSEYVKILCMRSADAQLALRRRFPKMNRP